MTSSNPSYYKHPNALVETDQIGEGTRVWAFVHVLKNVSIGQNCNICDFCFIESNVIIGNNVTVKSGIYLWEGAVLEDNVFLGPNVVFTNDLRPRSKQYKESVRTLICEGASIGANSTVLAGTRVGRYAMSGIGSVITRDIPDYALVYGNPAKQRGWVDEQGEKLTQTEDGNWVSVSGRRFRPCPTGLEPIE